MEPNDNFGWALVQIKDGRSVSRTSWNGTGMHVSLQRPDENSKMTLPYLYLSYVDGRRVPWLASQTDLLAEDWQIGSN